MDAREVKASQVSLCAIAFTSLTLRLLKLQAAMNQISQFHEEVYYLRILGNLPVAKGFGLSFSVLYLHASVRGFVRRARQI